MDGKSLWHPPQLSLNKSPIAIIGAGVFGLSTLDLARRGYTNVTVFDKQPYWNTKYDFDSGCDAASAGMRLPFKVFKAASDFPSNGRFLLKRVVC